MDKGDGDESKHKKAKKQHKKEKSSKHSKEFSDSQVGCNIILPLLIN